MLYCIINQKNDYDDGLVRITTFTYMEFISEKEPAKQDVIIPVQYHGIRRRLIVMKRKHTIIAISLLLFIICGIGASVIREISVHHEQKVENDIEYDIITNGDTTLIKDDYTLSADSNDNTQPEYNIITDNDTENPNLNEESWNKYNIILNGDTILIKEAYVTP